MLGWLPSTKQEKKVNAFGFKLTYDIPTMKGRKINAKNTQITFK